MKSKAVGQPTQLG